MTLEEAIKHAEEVVEEQEKIAIYTPIEMLNSDVDIEKCKECAEEHRQLAEWLKDYKRLLEQEPTTQERQAESDKFDAAFQDGYNNGYAQARFDYEQEPFINKPCVSSGVCEHDKQKVLDKIRAEIKQYQSDYDVHGTEYDRTAWKAFNRCLQIIDKYKAESENK